MTMKLPRLFLQVHQDQLFKLFMQAGEVVRIIPREPLGMVDLSGPETQTVEVVTVRCINDRGTVRFEAFSKDDLAVAAAWAEKHRDTAPEEFEWLPEDLKGKAG